MNIEEFKYRIVSQLRDRSSAFSLLLCRGDYDLKIFMSRGLNPKKANNFQRQDVFLCASEFGVSMRFVWDANLSYGDNEIFPKGGHHVIFSEGFNTGNHLDISSLEELDRLTFFKEELEYFKNNIVFVVHQFGIRHVDYIFEKAEVAWKSPTVMFNTTTLSFVSNRLEGVAAWNAIRKECLNDLTHQRVFIDYCPDSADVNNLRKFVLSRKSKLYADTIVKALDTRYDTTTFFGAIVDWLYVYVESKY